MAMTKTCKKCGAEEVYADGRCKPCRRASKVAQYTANPEKMRARSAAYRAANPEKVKAVKAAWYVAHREEEKAKRALQYTANPEKMKARVSAWRGANPEAKRVHDHTRRARKLGSGGKLSRGLKARLFEDQKGKCKGCCRAFALANFTLDHIVALSNGGLNVDGNMQLLCSPCNSKKRVKDNPVFLTEMRAKRRTELL